MYRACCVACMIGLGLPLSAAGAAEPSAFTMTREEFGALSREDQKSVVAGALTRLFEHSRNVSYRAETYLRVHDCSAGQLGKSLSEGFRWKFKHSILDGKDRLDTDLYRAPIDSDPDRVSIAGFDGAEGVGRSTMHTTENPTQRYGRIMSERHPLDIENRYGYWFDGEDNQASDHLIRYLVQHREEFSIDAAPPDDGLVQLTVPWTSRFSPGNGTFTLLLDPVRNFLPVRGEGRRQATRSGRRTTWRLERFFVESAERVEDTWMPTKLVEWLATSSIEENVDIDDPRQVAVWETVASEIQFGTVTPEDVFVPFPEGTQVVDAIEGIAYVAGADGKPAGRIERLVGREIPAATVPGAASKRGGLPRGLLLINGVVVILIAGWFLYRRSRGSPPA